MISDARLRALIRQEIDAYAFPSVAVELDRCNERISALEHRAAILHQARQEAQSGLLTQQAAIDASHALLREQAMRRPSSFTVKHLTSVK